MAVCVSSLARWIPTQACGPCAKATCDLALGPRDPVRVRLAEGRRVAVGSGQRHDHEVAPPDHRTAELGVGGRVPIDPGRGGLEPQRLLDGVGAERSVGAEGRELVRVVEQVPEQRCRQTLAGLDGSEHHHRGIGDDLITRQRGGRLGQHPIAA